MQHTINSLISAKSSRHHYIPKFYIEGFTNSDCKVYVYDKTKDKIINKEQSPKSIFFAWNENSINTKEGSTSILEDSYYNQIDSECSKGFTNLKLGLNNKELLNEDNLALVDLFVLTLFWRIPKTEFAFINFLKNAKIKFLTKEGLEVVDNSLEFILKNDKAYQKISKAFLWTKAVKKIITQNPQPNAYAKLFDYSSETFLIGDFPILYSQIPKRLEDIISLNYFLPISSNRLYLKSNKSAFKFTFKDAIRLNSLIIDQSVNFICASNKEFLEKSIASYKMYKNSGYIYQLRDLLFVNDTMSLHEPTQ